jgi:hypothetical protein
VAISINGAAEMDLSMPDVPVGETLPPQTVALTAPGTVGALYTVTASVSGNAAGHPMVVANQSSPVYYTAQGSP